MLYADYSATTPLKPEVKEWVINNLDRYGNPNSQHMMGSEAHGIINEATLEIASFLNCKSEDIHFCSSASEANDAAIKGWQNCRNGNVYFTNTSHASMRVACDDEDGFPIRVDDNGLIDTFQLEYCLGNSTADGESALFCFELANSIYGTVQNLEEIDDIAFRTGADLLIDATQWLPHYRLDLSNLKSRWIVTFSAHKLGSLKGVGVLVKRRDFEICKRMSSAKEGQIFAGTPNVLGIGALGVALKYWDGYKISHGAEKIWNNLKNEFGDDVKFIGLPFGDERRMSTNLCMSFPKLDGASLVMMADVLGLCISQTSACNTESYIIDPALKALGLKEDVASGVVRISLSGNETKGEIDSIAYKLASSVRMLLQEKEK